MCAGIYSFGDFRADERSNSNGFLTILNLQFCAPFCCVEFGLADLGQLNRRVDIASNREGTTTKTPREPRIYFTLEVSAMACLFSSCLLTKSCDERDGFRSAGPCLTTGMASVWTGSQTHVPVFSNISSLQSSNVHLLSAECYLTYFSDQISYF